MKCRDCGGEAIFYDVVNRRVLYEDRRIVYISLVRSRCTICHRIHRVSHSEIVPFKHYARSVMFSESHEGNYPSPITIYRWSQKKQPLY